MASEHNSTTTSPLAYHRILSPNASVKVSPICLGAMNFGGKWEQFMGECSKETAFDMFDHFHACGGNFIDTANMYMVGESEAWVGEWMHLRKSRDQIILATKYTNPVRSLGEEKEGVIASNYAGNGRKSLRLALEESLQRLQTNYVDIYYVHVWDGLTSIPELMRALDEVVRAGKVLYLGVSNWPAWIVVKANDYAREHGLTPFVAYEGRWNPADREIEREIVPMCMAEGMAITAWGALGGGKFKSTLQKKEDGGRNFANDLGSASLETFQKIAVVMEEIGKQKKTDATAIALRYVMLKAPYVFPIVGGRTVEQLKRNIAALKIELSNDEITKIESVVPFDFGYPHSLLSENRYKRISTADPAFVVARSGLFDGVEETMPIRSVH